LPSITGQATQGSQLNEVHGTWTPSATNYNVQWERCNAAGANCSDISGATGYSYTLASADVGSTIRVLELASNANGDGAIVESPQTAVVQALPPSSPGAPGPPTSPSGGAGTASFTGATTIRTNAKILVRCTGGAGATCSLALSLTVNETKRSR
jgi:Ig domain of plant-specific actin-binding protein